MEPSAQTGQADRQGQIDALQQQVDIYRRIFDSIHHGSMVTDANGYVTHFNAPYGRFLGLDPEAQIGRHCTEVLENTRMHIVAQTGVAEINHPHRIKSQNMVVQRIPIRQNGRVVAVFGQVMFKNISEVGKLAQKLSVLESKVRIYEEELLNLRATRYSFDSISGRSKAMRELKREALRATANTFPVLITGESGTGKELFAQAIHHASARKFYPFVRINCAAIPKDLLESELFGYAKGAFTGARASGKPGKFELAHRGTLFLDEIGDLPFEMQPKLLRVLEEHEFERVGGNRVIRSDFRLIAATNQPLEQLMEERRFRRDLFYRLNVVRLPIPPLRRRRPDIAPLADHLIQRHAEEANITAPVIDPAARRLLSDYDWPGNARELANVLERVLFSLEGDTIRTTDLPYYLVRQPALPAGSGRLSIRTLQQETEKRAIEEALNTAGGNKSRAARLLGIHRTLLYKKLKRHGIKP